MEETLVFQMTQLISEMEGYDKKKKSDLALNIIGLLFVYLRGLGLSDGEMIKYYGQYKSRIGGEDFDGDRLNS